MMQEAAAVFVAKANATSLGKRYAVVSSSSLDGKRDQNSLVLLSRRYFDPASVREHTAAVMATVLTMSSTVVPRERSLTGLFRPCSTGPMAIAPAERCTAL